MKPIDGIYPTMCATFPRSGHVIVRFVLRDYFGPRLHWTDFHRWPERGFNRAPGCNLEKNHDFDMKVKIRKDRQHLVQIRNPFDAMAGWKAMKIREKSKNQNWPQWHKDITRYWAAFARKWVYGSVPNRLVVPYERMMEEPIEVFAKIIQFLTHKNDIDLLKLSQIIAARKVRPRKPHPRPYASV